MTPAEFAQAASVSRETLAHFLRYQEVLTKWQSRINLIGPATVKDIWSRHFLDSAQLYPLLAASHKGRRGPAVLYDLGSGAGFPGLVLALMARGAGQPLDVHLVESDRRKAAFLAEMCRETGLARAVTIHALRIEALPLERLPRADVVTARALAALSELLTLAAPLLGPHGIALFLKGAKAADELTQAAKHWKMQVERLPSRTDSAGTILKLAAITRV
ncbi:MAG TPA: 16S rRNA (guanine(527)-N(7))-methyltransferase RsmG [Alphaproteobacteria bacterium]|nr:16S rRNA (guanine(527)-N(7))-methyltransferase RsmG [Alphaproteobacteria bacterium]